MDIKLNLDTFSLEKALQDEVTRYNYTVRKTYLSLMQRFHAWKERTQYVGIITSITTPSTWNETLKPEFLGYVHTEYCLGQIEYDPHSDRRDWRFSMYGKDHVDTLISVIDSLSKKYQASVDIRFVSIIIPKIRQWKEYRKEGVPE